MDLQHYIGFVILEKYYISTSAYPTVCLPPKIYFSFVTIWLTSFNHFALPPTLSCLITTTMFSVSVCFFVWFIHLFCFVCFISFFILYIWVKSYSFCLFPSDLFCVGFPGSSDGKESACKTGDLGLIPGSGRSPGEGNGNPLQYSCLENSMDREPWRATLHGVAKSWTWLSS